jgi:hypothetical protein
MKIAQLLSGIGIALTNEERTFLDKHTSDISINSLDEHAQWVAQNLVRKGVYSISKDRRTLLKKVNETNSI